VDYGGAGKEKFFVLGFLVLIWDQMLGKDGAKAW
jgi:hypothetical protein